MKKYINKLNKIFNNSNIININNNSKIVIISDCHRGKKDLFDNFSKNENIYLYALNYYFKHNFVYIELGDGDELWEVDSYEKIIKSNIDVFKIINKFNLSNRFYMIYGNHDSIKSKNNYLKNYDVYESIILKYNEIDMFLLHGHQVDIFNSNYIKITRIIIKTFWKFLEKYLVNDPTKLIKNYKVSKRVEKHLNNWTKKMNKILIAGHTHRPIFPVNNKSLYFNSGSCVHPDGITTIEIDNSFIRLTKWYYKIKKENLIKVSKNVIREEKIIELFNQYN